MRPRAQSEKCQQRESASSFDYRVRLLLKMRRHIEAKGLGRLHVDDQLELDWGLHRKLARLLALEDAIDIGRGKPK